MAEKTQKTLVHYFGKHFVYVFSVILLLDLWAGSKNSDIRWATKPLLLISLILYSLLWRKSIPKTEFKVLFGGLLFSLAGDVFLLSDESLFFIFGLTSFLLAHICYILLFSKDLASSINWYKIVIAIAVFVYATLLFNYLSPHLNDMLLPVILYILAILTMVTMAILRKDNSDKVSYNRVLIGALLFMGSDSILAVDKFVNPLPYASIIIMICYAAAQYFIVTGVIKRALH